ncbi:MAG: hypothetical protein VX877_11315, partial [Planctomycetota bacterium]|nr:hypothetical protein [Planctomycetota bacterium]
RALYGLAIVAEAKCSGKDKSVDEAVEAYKRLVAIEGPYQALAKSRVESLESGAATEFYKWFVEVAETPTPDPVTPAFGSGANGHLPPGLLEGLTGENGKSSPHQPEPDSSSKDTRTIPGSVPLPGTKPDAKKPAAKKPAAKKPAAKKPAAKKPAAKKPDAKKSDAKKSDE